MELFTAIWAKIGTPITILLWGYLGICALVVIGAIIVFAIMVGMVFKDQKRGW